MPLSVVADGHSIVSPKAGKRARVGLAVVHTAVCAYPERAVARHEEGVYLPFRRTLQMVGGEFARRPVHTYQSVARAYPEAVALVFSQREHGIVGKQSRRHGIAAIGDKAVAVV